MPARNALLVGANSSTPKKTYSEDLSTLVAELLAFTNTNSSAVTVETIALYEIITDLAARELGGHVETEIAVCLSVEADRRFLTRDTGGMAIVESSVRACGGKVSAEKSPMGGLLVKMVMAKG